MLPSSSCTATQSSSASVVCAASLAHVRSPRSAQHDGAPTDKAERRGPQLAGHCRRLWTSESARIGSQEAAGGVTLLFWPVWQVSAKSGSCTRLNRYLRYMFAARCKLHVALCMLHVERFMLHLERFTLHVKRYTLQVACHMLNVARGTIIDSSDACVALFVSQHEQSR